MSQSIGTDRIRLINHIISLRRGDNPQPAEYSDTFYECTHMDLRGGSFPFSIEFSACRSGVRSSHLDHSVILKAHLYRFLVPRSAHRSREVTEI